ncbi:MAG: FHA domain-containing protein [Hyphomicrobium sp.]
MPGSAPATTRRRRSCWCWQHSSCFHRLRSPASCCAARSTRPMRRCASRARPTVQEGATRRSKPSCPRGRPKHGSRRRGQKHVVGRAMLRIGREADNDICLQEKTVHRYHAVIRRSTDGEVIITDLSGPQGNGVLVNGARVGENRLKAGDVIGIGEVKLNFDARPI